MPRPLPEPAALDRAVAVLRSARKPLVIAGGGVIYSEASAALRRFAEATGIPVSDTQAGKGALAWDHPCAVGGVGATGSPVANALAREADVVLGVGTRYSDFTTASRTAFQNPDVKFVNLNVAAFDAGKHAGVALVADARAGLEALTEALSRLPRRRGVHRRNRERERQVAAVVEHAYHLGHQPLPAQTEILGALNEFMAERDVVVQAAGSMPGDLQMLWRARDPKQYHVEYGYSCMGYEIAGGLGAKLADPGREVFVLVGDGSYLMMAHRDRHRGLRGHQADHHPGRQPRLRLHRLAVGVARLAAVRHQLPLPRPGTGLLDGGVLPVDLAANAASLGADVLRTRTVKEFTAALEQARASDRTTVVYIETDPLAPVPSSQSWWDVPVSETSALDKHAAGPRGLRGGQARSATVPVEGAEITDAYYPAANYSTANYSTLDRRLGDDRGVHPVRHGLEPRHRDGAGPGRAGRTGRRRRRRGGGQQGVAGVARRLAHPPGARHVRPARPHRAAPGRAVRARRRRARQGRLRRQGRGHPRPGGRGIRLRHPDPAQGRVLRAGLHRRGRLLVPAAARRLRGDHALQLPRHGAHVDASRRDRRREHLHPQAERA